MAKNQRAFNREMGSYITTKKRKKVVKGFGRSGIQLDRGTGDSWFNMSLFGKKSAEPVEKISEDDLSPEERARFEAMKQSGFKRNARQPEVERSEEEEIEEMHEELESEGFFSKLGRFIKGEPRDVEVMEIPQDELDEDVKLLLKGILRWLEQLPTAKKRMFKQSDEFKLYKQVLEKYELVKK